jgi:hypothetical protein
MKIGCVDHVDMSPALYNLVEPHPYRKSGFSTDLRKDPQRSSRRIWVVSIKLRRTPNDRIRQKAKVSNVLRRTDAAVGVLKYREIKAFGILMS